MSEGQPTTPFNYRDYSETTQPCPSCSGMGKKLLAALGLRNVFEEKSCIRCDGSGRVRQG